MAIQQVWSDHKVLAHGPFHTELSSVSFFLSEDLGKTLPASLSFQIVARVLGVQIGAITLSPLQNGNFSIPLLAQIGGDLNGRIDDLRAIDANGQSTSTWSNAAAAGFTVTALGTITIPLSTIVALVPGLGAIASAALAVLGNRLTITLAHDPIVAHLPAHSLAPVSV